MRSWIFQRRESPHSHAIRFFSNLLNSYRTTSPRKFAVLILSCLKNLELCSLRSKCAVENSWSVKVSFPFLVLTSWGHMQYQLESNTWSNIFVRQFFSGGLKMYPSINGWRNHFHPIKSLFASKKRKFLPLSFCSPKLKGPMHSCALALLLPGSALMLPITHLRWLSLKPFVKRLSVFKNLTLFEDPLHLLGYNTRSQKNCSLSHSKIWCSRSVHSQSRFRLCFQAKFS